MLVFIITSLISVSSFAASIPSGFPNKGTLSQAIDLFQFIKSHSEILHSVSPREHQYGTDQMAALLEKIGLIALEFKHAPMWVGDVSLKGGGKLAQHLTHQRGLDADIAYLVRARKKSGHRAKSFHNRFTQKWQTPKDVETSFLLKENYALLKALMDQPNVQSVYVGCSIYDALEKYDQTQSTSILKHIYAQKGHEDHFHVRIRCPEGLNECSDHWYVDPSKPQKKESQDKDGKFREC